MAAVRQRLASLLLGACPAEEASSSVAVAGRLITLAWPRWNAWRAGLAGVVGHCVPLRSLQISHCVLKNKEANRTGSAVGSLQQPRRLQPHHQAAHGEAREQHQVRQRQVGQWGAGRLACRCLACHPGCRAGREEGQGWAGGLPANNRNVGSRNTPLGTGVRWMLLRSLRPHPPTLNGGSLVGAPIRRHHRVTHRLLGDGAQQLAEQARGQAGSGRKRGLACWRSARGGAGWRWCFLCRRARGLQRIADGSEGGSSLAGCTPSCCSSCASSAPSSAPLLPPAADAIASAGAPSALPVGVAPALPPAACACGWAAAVCAPPLLFFFLLFFFAAPLPAVSSSSRRGGRSWAGSGGELLCRLQACRGRRRCACSCH